MTVTLSLLLLIVAFVLFALAAAGVPSKHVNWIGAGLACWVLSILVGQVHFG